MTGSVLRPASGGLRATLFEWVLGRAPFFFRVLRNVWPIPRLGKLAAVTRYDDVREVFRRDADFPTPYRRKLEIIMGGEPFFLGLPDGEAYRRDLAAMRAVVRPADIPERLAPATVAAATAAVAASGGRIEAVGFVRDVTFGVLAPYFGVSAPAGADLQVWATRLFEFQFTDLGDDPALRAEVDRIAPAFRAHVDSLIAARKATGTGPDDVLGRCLARQAAGEPGYGDTQIRTALLGMVVGGPPQPPMVVPNGIEQLLQRPAALAAAMAAARRDDDAAVAAHLWEAMRFDPLGPALQRDVARDTVIAAGTARATTVPAGTTLFVAFSSAMRDGRRIADPERFDASRPACDTLHFGHALHQCFGEAINRALLPLLLKPLLRQRGLRRAPGAAGWLRKSGGLAETLWVEFDR